MSVLGAVVAALLAVAALATAAAGRMLAAAAQADTAADAAALAAAPATFPAVGRPLPVVEARRVAASNGARLVVCRCPVVDTFALRVVDVEVVVVVEAPPFGTVEVPGRARAAFDPVAWLGGRRGARSAPLPRRRKGPPERRPLPPCREVSVRTRLRRRRTPSR